MGLFNFKREIEWDKDVMKVTDSLSNVWDSIVSEMNEKMKNDQTSEILRHFNIDMSELREFLQNKKMGVEPTKWIIPVSDETSPTTDETVLVTVLDGRGDTPFRFTSTGYYLHCGAWWIVDGEARRDVIAWAKMPEPYRFDISD